MGWKHSVDRYTIRDLKVITMDSTYAEEGVTYRFRSVATYTAGSIRYVDVKVPYDDELFDKSDAINLAQKVLEGMEYAVVKCSEGYFSPNKMLCESGLYEYTVYVKPTYETLLKSLGD